MKNESLFQIFAAFRAAIEQWKFLMFLSRLYGVRGGCEEITATSGLFWWIVMVDCLVDRLVDRYGGRVGLPPMWSEFDFRTRCHTWIEFVGSLLSSKNNI